jgi:hypothetical protein
MGRIFVDLPQSCVEELNAIAAAEKLSLAEVIRRALADYAKAHRPVAGDAFGIWKDRSVDGLSYQEEARSEWRVRCSIPGSWALASAASKRPGKK